MTDAKKTWVERFPKPEGERPPHPGEEPKWTEAIPRLSDGSPEFSRYCKAKDAWEEARKKFNTHGTATRKFIVARAIDELISRDRTVVEDAIRILGMEYLEGAPTTNIFGSLFGGLL